MQMARGSVRPVRYARISILVGLSLILSMTGAGWAEEGPGQKLVLDLDRMIAMVVDKSPAIGETKNEIEAAKSDLDQVKAAYYPQVDVTGLIGPIDDAKEPIIRNNKIYDPSPGLNLSNINAFGKVDVVMTQPIYTFGKLSNREDAARRGVKAKELELPKKKCELAVRVKQLYYALVLSREGLATAKNAGAFFDETKSRISRLLALGSVQVAETDLYRVEAYRADSFRFRAEAEKGEKTAYFALKAMLCLPDKVEFEPAEKKLTMKDEKPADLESYLHGAAARRPELKQLKEAVEAQQSMLQAAQSDQYPSFFAAAVGSLAGAPGRDALHNPYIADDFNHANGGVVAGVKWNFDFGIGRARIDKAKAEYHKIKNTQAYAEMNIPIQVAKCYQDVVEWQKAAGSYRAAATASRKWVVAALADFDMGVGAAGDLLNAIEKYGQNEGKYLEALFNYNVSVAELECAAGSVDKL
ncbi:MAG: TolC family protein [Deltaproteobacteria bacterium]|nr:TolC family protein [Deltaproteobacteria bacterium]